MTVQALFPPDETPRIFRAKTGQTYHAKQTCMAVNDGGEHWMIDWDEVDRYSLTPCAKCKPVDPRLADVEPIEHSATQLALYATELAEADVVRAAGILNDFMVESAIALQDNARRDQFAAVLAGVLGTALQLAHASGQRAAKEAIGRRLGILG